MTPVTLGAAAMAYAARAWWVLPLWWPEGDGCACGRPECRNAGKHPLGGLVPHGLEQANADAGQVARWWAAQPRANVGLRTGRVSGLVVVDVDGPVGEASLRALIERHSGRRCPDRPLAEAISPIAASGEGVPHIERLKFPEIAVIRVQRPDAVLEQDRRDVGVWDEVSANRHFSGYVLVRV